MVVTTESRNFTTGNGNSTESRNFTTENSNSNPDTQASQEVNTLRQEREVVSLLDGMLDSEIESFSNTDVDLERTNANDVTQANDVIVAVETVTESTDSDPSPPGDLDMPGLHVVTITTSDTSSVIRNSCTTTDSLEHATSSSTFSDRESDCIKERKENDSQESSTTKHSDIPVELSNDGASISHSNGVPVSPINTTNIGDGDAECNSTLEEQEISDTPL